MRLGKGHVGQHVLFGVVHEIGEFRHLQPDLTGDFTPLDTCGLRGVLDEHRGYEGGDVPSATFASMGQRVSHEVNPATLPGRTKNIGNCGLVTFMCIGDDKLDAPKPQRVSLDLPR